MSLLQKFIDGYWKLDTQTGQKLHSVKCKPFEQDKPSFSDNRVTEAVRTDNTKWFHEEVVVQFRDALVEAQYGYVMTGFRSIAESSIRTAYRPPLPSPHKALRAFLSGRAERIEEAILFDGSLSSNYFHFFSDVLPKIFLLEEFTGLSQPILVGNKTFNLPQFRFFVENTELSKLNWLPITKPLRVDNLTVSQPLPFKQKYSENIKHLVLKKDLARENRTAIFITRLGARSISNLSEIESICAANDVAIVNTAAMDVGAQAEAVNSATHIIGIHGAAMANLIFAQRPTKALELCSPKSIRTQVYWLCKSLGLYYDMMLGSSANANQSFTVDAQLFARQLAEFLSD